jgi:hypothetical protein
MAARTASFTGTETASLNGAPVQITVNGVDSYWRRDATYNQTITIGGVTTVNEARYVGAATYIAIPATKRTSMSAGKPWLQYSGLSSLDTSGYPTDVIVLLESHPTDVRRVGPRIVDGTPTTEYQAQISLSKAPTYGALLSGLISQFQTEFGQVSVPIMVWVDTKGRVRQIHLSFSGSGNTENQTLHLFNFGEPVDVLAPPASAVHTEPAPSSSAQG